MSSKQTKKDYISVIYSEGKKPFTSYPDQLTFYLVKKYGLSEGQTILDLGCGRGEFLNGFIHHGLNGCGVDRSLAAKSICPQAEILQSDFGIEPLPYKENSFDIVFLKSVIEHFYDPEKLLQDIYRILKPGGMIIVLTPDWASQMRIFYEDFTHRRPYDATALANLLAIYGFSDIRTELFYQLPFLWRYPFLKIFSRALQMVLSVPNARSLTSMTHIKFFRWSVELMVLGSGIKK